MSLAQNKNTKSMFPIMIKSKHVCIGAFHRRHYRAGGQVVLERSFEDWEPGRVISCRNCGKVQIVLVCTVKSHVVL